MPRKLLDTLKTTTKIHSKKTQWFQLVSKQQFIVVSFTFNCYLLAATNKWIIYFIFSCKQPKVKLCPSLSRSEFITLSSFSRFYFANNLSSGWETTQRPFTCMSVARFVVIRFTVVVAHTHPLTYLVYILIYIWICRRWYVLLRISLSALSCPFAFQAFCFVRSVFQLFQFSSFVALCMYS